MKNMIITLALLTTAGLYARDEGLFADYMPTYQKPVVYQGEQDVLPAAYYQTQQDVLPTAYQTERGAPLNYTNLSAQLKTQLTDQLDKMYINAKNLRESFARLQMNRGIWSEKDVRKVEVNAEKIRNAVQRIKEDLTKAALKQKNSLDYIILKHDVNVMTRKIRNIISRNFKQIHDVVTKNQSEAARDKEIHASVMQSSEWIKNISNWIADRLDELTLSPAEIQEKRTLQSLNDRLDKLREV